MLQLSEIEKAKPGAGEAIICLLFAILLAAPKLVMAEDQRTDARTLARDDKSSITYYIDQAESGASTNVLLLVLQGSDCNSAVHQKSIHEVFRDVWSAADLLTIEKYGIDASLPHSKNPERPDCPGSYLQEDSPERRSEDALRVLEFVLAEHQYDSVILLGGSEGATVANLIAAKADSIDASIVFNGGGRWFLDDVLHSVSSQSASIEEEEETISGLTKFAEHILNSEPFELAMSGHGYAWWRNVLEVDQQSLLKSVKSPVLLIQSGKDQAVSPALVDEMMTELEKAGKENIEYLKYENLDHGLNDEHGISQMPRVSKDMQDWLKNTLAKKPAK